MMKFFRYPDKYLERDSPPIARTGNGTVNMAGFTVLGGHSFDLQLCVNRAKDGVIAARSYMDIPADPDLLRDLARFFEECAQELDTERAIREVVVRC